MALSKEERSKIQKEAKQKQAKEKYDKTHKEIDGVLYKQCNKHKENFPEEDDWFPCTTEFFYVNKSNKSDGLYPYCKECDKAKSMDWKHNNVKRTSELRKRYRKKEETRKKEENRKSNEKYRASGKALEYQRKNKDKFKKYRLNREMHKTHQVNKNEWISCKTYFNNCCAYCGLPIEEHFRKRLGETQQVDLHKEHVYENGRNDLKNCVPACQTCNSMKLKTSFNDWYNPNNPVYTYERYHKICQWIHYDCKKYIEPKKPKGEYTKKKKEYWENKREYLNNKN